MALYKIGKTKLELIKEKPNLLEKDVQKIVGENLYELLGLKFIEFEFQVSGKRIDILAFDEELNAPVLIELKRDNDRGLFDQGMEYFNILLDRDKKHVFLTTLSQKLKIDSDINSINWSNSRVIFVGKNFTQRQMRAIDFKGIPIELWDYSLYENDLFELKEIGLEKKVDLEINLNQSNNSNLEKIKREFKEYDLDFHIKKGSEKTIELLKNIREEILKIDPDIKEGFKKVYIGYQVNNKNFITLSVQKNNIYVDFGRAEPKDLIDPEQKLKYQENSVKWFGQHISRVTYDNIDDLDYIISLVRQNLKRTKQL